jgi:hypothetical protein
MAVIRYAERHGTRRPWLVQLMQRPATKIAAVALANKTARIIWALMTSGECYREPVAASAMAAWERAHQAPPRLGRADRSECTKPVETAGSGGSSTSSASFRSRPETRERHYGQRHVSRPQTKGRTHDRTGQHCANASENPCQRSAVHTRPDSVMGL